ncbi:uncharacterized protein DUF348 [Alkalibaculum bacchi]|uniref:Uncharacterized protein DUF348 n=1 Tax=Alkalibaculum bacchi TaxID=645887 RepID=A0A366IBV3_9FIRM|nr:3D domain-containing protein [Alkalibaculum bacchi]RBP68247.1 uncharacterized protein DUF348 [Alkalibaculum bacchi]
MNLECIRFFFIRKKMIFIGVALFVLTAVLALIFSYRQVIIEVDNQKVQYAYNGNKTVAEVLKANQITVKEEDIVKPARNEVLKDGSVINIDRAIPVRIFVEGEYREIYTTQKEVAKILEDANVVIEDHDIVKPALYASVNRGDNIHVTRVDEKFDTTEIVIKYEKIVKENNSLEEGQFKIVQKGVDGLKTIVEKATYHDGVEFNREVVDEKTLDPVDEIKEVGKRAKLVANRSSTNTPVKGRTITIEATGYCSCHKCCGPYDGSTTASGISPAEGRTVAASKNYSFGTKVYIPYFSNTFVVEDRGGAIQGNRIDIYFSSHQEALRFGRRTLEATIVN